MTSSSSTQQFGSPEEVASWLTQTAMGFMQSTQNDLHMPDAPEPAFGLPIFGFAAGDDPLWEDYKMHVGEFHWTPTDAFALRYPGEKVDASELTIMSWVNPKTPVTCRDNSKKKELPAERWVRARVFGERHVNNVLRQHLTAALDDKGIQCVAPMLLPEWHRIDAGKYVYASNWSERHAAYAAGLGTFGLCDGLITPVGKAMRTGSIIIRMRLPITKRPYTNHREYCLYFNSGTCGICTTRCPVNALSENGHDKVACRKFMREVTTPFIDQMWHFEGYGCGLCQVGVPCEKGIPQKPTPA